MGPLEASPSLAPPRLSLAMPQTSPQCHFRMTSETDQTWSVELEGGVWGSLPAEACRVLNLALEHGQLLCYINMKGGLYKMDLQEMQQTNIKTGVSRKIQVNPTSGVAGQLHSSNAEATSATTTSPASSATMPLPTAFHALRSVPLTWKYPAATVAPIQSPPKVMSPAYYAASHQWLPQSGAPFTSKPLPAPAAFTLLPSSAVASYTRPFVERYPPVQLPTGALPLAPSGGPLPNFTAPSLTTTYVMPPRLSTGFVPPQQMGAKVRGPAINLLSWHWCPTRRSTCCPQPCRGGRHVKVGADTEAVVFCTCKRGTWCTPHPLRRS